MKRRSLVTAAVGLGAAGAGLVWHLGRPAAEGAPPTTTAPSDAETAFWALRFEQPAGGELQLASLRGQPLLLNFWATWCPPCVKEMPMLDSFHQQQRAKGWQVLGLAVDSPTPVRDFLARRPMGFPIGLAGLDGVDLAKSLGNKGGQLPFTVVFNRQAVVIERKLGAVEPADLQRWASLVG